MVEETFALVNVHAVRRIPSRAIYHIQMVKSLDGPLFVEPSPSPKVYFAFDSWEPEYAQRLVISQVLACQGCACISFTSFTLYMTYMTCWDKPFRMPDRYHSSGVYTLKSCIHANAHQLSSALRPPFVYRGCTGMQMHERSSWQAIRPLTT